MIKTYQPQISVHLVKSKPVNGFCELNITPWLGDGSTVETTKSVHQPAGTFLISLPDQPYQGQSLNDFIEPMDFVEIRMAHEKTSNKDGSLPLIMRGFVSSILQSQAMTGGKPQQWLKISGHDYGKILQIIQVVYLPSSITGQMFTEAFKWFQIYSDNTQIKTKSAADFIAETLNYVINPFIQKLTFLTQATKKAMVINAMTAKTTVEGDVSAFTPSSFENVSLFQMLAKIMDAHAFNELYTQDSEDGVVLIVRPSPMKDFDSGKFIQGTTDSAAIAKEDVISLNVTRDDHDVANFFWVTLNSYGLMTNELQKMSAAGDSLDDFAIFNYKNAAMDTFGIRKMEVESVLMPPNFPYSDSPTEQQVNELKTSMDGWIRTQRKLLKDLNKDNVMFEKGSLQLRGNESLKAGDYLTLADGREIYAHTISHQFRLFQSFFTHVQFDRGRFVK